MSATQPATQPATQLNSQKGQRRPPRKPHHGGQSSRSVVSDNDAYNAMVENNGGSTEGKSRTRRKSHATKKGYPQNDAAAYSDGPVHRPVAHQPKTQATPIKQQAYAGPTFHQSPAASALPIPSFYSKSLPIASPLKAGMDGTQSPSRPIAELNQPVEPPLPNEPKRESTPLDFLFDAARKASATPGAESPNHRQYLSSAADTPVSRSPAAREGDADFPFELDAGDQTVWNGQSTFSTPYKDRIEAVRTQRVPSSGGKSMDEDERKAKTAALKQFLMNSAQHQNHVPDNPFNARPIPSHTQYQPRSSPNTPFNAPDTGTVPQYFPPVQPVSHMVHYPSPTRPGLSSNLRNVYQPPSEMSANMTPNMAPNIQLDEQDRISTAREHTPGRPNFGDIYSTTNKPQSQGSTHHTTPSAQQLEDDLRKFLKLDLVSRG